MALNSKLDANQVLRQSYDDVQNRLRVDASVSATVADMDVIIEASSGDNIAIADPTGTNFLEPNSDGSINVNIVNSVGIGSNKLQFYEITSVPMGVSTTIGIYIVPFSSTAFLQQVLVSGSNYATFEVYINGFIISRKLTNVTNLNEDFGFAVTSNNGMTLNSGDQVEIKVLHGRPNLGDFNTSLQLIVN